MQPDIGIMLMQIARCLLNFCESGISMSPSNESAIEMLCPSVHNFLELPHVLMMATGMPLAH